MAAALQTSLILAATAHYNAGQLHEALWLLELLHRFRPNDGWPLYNIACAMARLGRVAGALEPLELAIARDPSWAATAETDDDFVTLRDDARLRAIVGRAADAPERLAPHS